MEKILATLPEDVTLLASEYIGFLRYALPVLAALLLLRCFLPLMTFRREPASEMVQLPSSYRVRTAWFLETVPSPKVTSQDLLRPITVSQWVTGI